MLEKVDFRLKCLWFIKTLRIRDIVVYTSKKFYQPGVDSIIQWKQDQALKDYKKSHETTQDHNYIDTKMFVGAFLKIVSILVQILLMVYLVGQAWIIFVDL